MSDCGNLAQVFYFTFGARVLHDQGKKIMLFQVMERIGNDNLITQ